MIADKTNGWAADTIENEGLAGALLDYCGGNVFKDRTTRNLWNLAASALEELIVHLEEETGRRVDGR